MIFIFMKKYLKFNVFLYFGENICLHFDQMNTFFQFLLKTKTKEIKKKEREIIFYVTKRILNFFNNGAQYIFFKEYLLRVIAQYL